MFTHSQQLQEEAKREARRETSCARFLTAPGPREASPTVRVASHSAHPLTAMKVHRGLPSGKSEGPCERSGEVNALHATGNRNGAQLASLGSDIVDIFEAFISRSHRSSASAGSRARPRLPPPVRHAVRADAHPATCPRSREFLAFLSVGTPQDCVSKRHTSRRRATSQHASA